MAASDNKYDSFFFRASWWQSMKNLPNGCREEVYDAVCMYVFEGKEPTFDPMSATSMAVRFILTDVDRDKAKYAEVSERRAAAGRRGGKAKAANVANAKKELQEPENERQNVANLANVANATKEKKRKEKEGKEVNINNNDNNSSFSFPADAEKKEKIIFDFSLVLLSEGRPNAYNEAREAYGYNDATGWESEKTDTAGNVTKKKIRNKLAWIEAGWKRHNEQVFAPAHGQILADILRQTGMRPENADVINAFRGFRFEGDETNIAFLYTRKTAWQKFAAAISTNDAFNKTVFGELTKVFPKVKQLHFTIY